MFGCIYSEAISLINRSYQWLYPMNETDEWNINFTAPAQVLIDGYFIPSDIIKEVLSHLSFQDLLNCSEVNKKEWRPLTNDSLVLKKVIWHDKIFSPKDWIFNFGAKCLEKNEVEEAWNKLPIDIGQIFKSPCTLFPKKKLGETHQIVWIPAGMSINRYGNLLKKKFPHHSKGYALISDQIINRHGNKTTKKSNWILMSRKAIPGSYGKKQRIQLELIKNLNNKDGQFRTLPSTLEAIICISTTFFKSENPIVRGYYTRCEEEASTFSNVVGFALSGLYVDSRSQESDDGMIATVVVRKSF